MWLLGHLLPAMMGHNVPMDDEYWKNFILLLKNFQQKNEIPLQKEKPSNSQAQVILRTKQWIALLHSAHLKNNCKCLGKLKYNVILLISDKWCTRSFTLSYILTILLVQNTTPPPSMSDMSVAVTVNTGVSTVFQSIKRWKVNRHYIWTSVSITLMMRILY